MNAGQFFANDLSPGISLGRQDFLRTKAMPDGIGSGIVWANDGRRFGVGGFVLRAHDSKYLKSSWNDYVEQRNPLSEITVASVTGFESPRPCFLTNSSRQNRHFQKSDRLKPSHLSKVSMRKLEKVERPIYSDAEL
jgi:hypothetical protein